MELDYVKLKEIKPALAGYIRESQTLLKKSIVPDENVTHDVRVLMKKSRAALRLIVPQLDKEYFDKDIYTLREVGRIMCKWRETSVHRRVLKELRKEYLGIFSQLHDNEKITALLKKPDPGQEPPADIVSGMEQIENLLNRTGYRIRFEDMSKIDPRLLIKELEFSYSKVVEIYMICRNNPRPVNVHDFRKRSKDFLYQLYFFRPLNIQVVKALEKKLDIMTQNLGRVNDLSQLIKALGYKYPDSASIPAMDELIVIIREKQDRYMAKVWPTAYKIFCPGNRLVNVLGFKLLVI